MLYHEQYHAQELKVRTRKIKHKNLFVNIDRGQWASSVRSIEFDCIQLIWNLYNQFIKRGFHFIP